MINEAEIKQQVQIWDWLVVWTRYVTAMYVAAFIWKLPEVAERTLIRHKYRVLSPSYIMDLFGKAYLKCKHKEFLLKTFDLLQFIP